nr:type IV secretion system protein [Arsenophonus endosymbiont of Apis mellifera]
MNVNSIEKATALERQLHYNEGLEGKEHEVGKTIMAYTQAARWFEHRVAEDYRKKAKNARILAIIFGLLALMSTLAVMLLTPLKTVEPYVIRVDKNSGYMDIIKPLDDRATPADVVQDKHFISTYVLARESYNWASHAANYAFVQLTSASDVFEEYRNFQLSSKGYVAKLGQSQQVRIAIDSIVLLPITSETALNGNEKMKTYQVRFTQTLLGSEGKMRPISTPLEWIVTISIDHNNPPSSEGDQWLNPLGYGVRAYNTTLTSSPTFTLRDSGGGFPLVGDYLIAQKPGSCC